MGQNHHLSSSLLMALILWLLELLNLSSQLDVLFPLRIVPGSLNLVELLLGLLSLPNYSAAPLSQCPFPRNSAAIFSSMEIIYSKAV